MKNEFSTLTVGGLFCGGVFRWVFAVGFLRWGVAVGCCGVVLQWGIAVGFCDGVGQAIP
ncbi:MAG: hypothetical protein RR728_04445 [Oscillospiraceae bacterium]